MAIPVDLLNDSPHESSDEELSDSMEDEPSEPENSSEGSRSSLPTLERKVTDGDAEKEFWLKYPFIKMLMGVLIDQGLPDYYAYEQAKLIGDDKAKVLNDQGRALFLEELEIHRKKLALVASALTDSGI